MEETIISVFLKENCTTSPFEQDYILIQDLKERYEEYCFEQNVVEIQRSNIIGSEELVATGAEYTETVAIGYIRGITMGKKLGEKQHIDYIAGLVRISKDQEEKNYKHKIR